ncbi:MAG: DedA family protein [Candidatus Paceibacterota bacterium]|jgi:membrane-associated protein|nr:DedA family protein [Candidatus Paceibacterota bacterium]
MINILTSTIADMSLWLSLHANLAYAILFFGSYFETVVGPGFFIYGELFFLPGAILAGAGFLNIWLVALATISGGILGDYTSYEIGRKHGHRIFRFGNKYFSPENHEKGKVFFKKHGPKAIFFARLLGPFSWITPFFAGTYGISRRTFFAYNIPGVFAGIGEFLVVGYFFGTSYGAALQFIQQKLAYILAALFVLFSTYYIIKRNDPEFFIRLGIALHLIKKD